MADFSVRQYGTDVYGRPVFMTVFMAEWFESYVEELGFRPGIAQGAWMERLGGGAAASQGAHDKGKCLDLRTTDRTTAEIDRMVRVARIRGAGAYRRDRTWRHGSMTPHMHLTLGADARGSAMAEALWLSYVNNGDGLGIEPPQPDYEWRPDPLVLVPPEEDEMKEADWERLDKVLDAKVKSVLDGLGDAKVDIGRTAKWSLSRVLKLLVDGDSKARK